MGEYPDIYVSRTPSFALLFAENVKIRGLLCMSWNISRVNYYGNKCVVMGINECHVNFLSSWSHMMHFHLVRFAGACLPAVWRSKLHPKPQLPPHTLASWLPGRWSAFFAACHSPTCSLSMLNRHHEGMDFTHPLPETCRQTKE